MQVEGNGDEWGRGEGEEGNSVRSRADDCRKKGRGYHHTHGERGIEGGVKGLVSLAGKYKYNTAAEVVSRRCSEVENNVGKCRMCALFNSSPFLVHMWLNSCLSVNLAHLVCTIIVRLQPQTEMSTIC